LEPFWAAGAVAGVLAAWGWDGFGASPQPHAAALQSLAAGAAVTGDGVFAGSLIVIFVFVYWLQWNAVSNPFRKRHASRILAGENEGKALRCNRMQRSEAIPPGLREFATWNFSKANCEFSFLTVQVSGCVPRTQCSWKGRT